MAASSASTSPVASASYVRPSMRRLIVAWQHPRARAIQPVGILAFDGKQYYFDYIERVLNVEGFEPFVSFPDLRKNYKSTRLFPIFAQRVMDARRPDFHRYIETLDLATVDATPWEQLIRSEGRRTGDSVMVFPEPVVGPDAATSCHFLVHGIRHILRENPAVEAKLQRLRPGDRLSIVPEPTNPVNDKAILTVDEDSVALGWVPDLLLDYVHAVRSTGPYAITVQHVNGPDAPVHLRLLVCLEGSVPPGYLPFRGESWQPLTREGI
ncbi:hypothetical protein [Micromonospora sp. BL4]|uniref:hypothetical protein n=1 Tax=Micromonospora sp. BL4 TaxID=2478710 RepID=UPI0011C392D6|nr:hypothetical protein [Micromonospora sp. BL4]